MLSYVLGVVGEFIDLVKLLENFSLGYGLKMKNGKNVLLGGSCEADSLAFHVGCVVGK